MNTTPITDIMTRQVHTIDVKEDVIKARNLMDKYEINHLPVTEDGKLVGILSSNDMRQAIYLSGFVGERLESGTIFKSLSLDELMTENVQTLTTKSTMEEAIQIFGSSCFQCLPVVDGDSLVGIITTKDLFASILTEV